MSPRKSKKSKTTPRNVATVRQTLVQSAAPASVVSTRAPRTQSITQIDSAKAQPHVPGSKMPASFGIERLSERFPNFLLGLTVVIILFILFSFLFDTPRPFNIPGKNNGLLGLFRRPGTQVAPDTLQQPRTYVVKEGDHLWTIAEGAYGSGENAYDIAKANNLQEPYYLEAGQKLIIPDVASKTPTVGEVTQTEIAVVDKKPQATSTYVVQPGDSLSSIAQTFYGNNALWTKIRDANASTLPASGDVAVGQILTIPPNK